MSKCSSCNIECDPNIQYQCENCGEVFWRTRELFEKNKEDKDYKQKVKSTNYEPVKLNEKCEYQQQVYQLLSHASISLAEGNAKETIIADFIKNGILKEDAEAIVNEANSFKKSIFRKNGIGEVISGIGLLVLGGVITAISYSMAGSGGTYIVAGGAIFVGAIITIRGLWRCIVG